MKKLLYSLIVLPLVALGCGDDQASSSHNEAQANTMSSTNNNEQTGNETNNSMTTNNGLPTLRGCPRLVEGAIVEDTAFNECETYVMKAPLGGDIMVSARLSISPETTVVMPADTGLYIGRDGELVAEGTSDTMPVVFTGAQPERGFWKGIRVGSPSVENRLRHVVIEHAGSDIAAVEVEEFGRVTLEDVEIRSTDAAGLKLHEDSTLQTMERVRFEGVGGYPVEVYGNGISMLDKDSDYTGAAEPYILIEDTDDIDEDATWQTLNVPYLFGPNLNDRHRILATITIEAGTKVVFDSQIYLQTKDQGAIRAFGSAEAPITFTGLQSTKGFWGGLWIGASRVSEFEHTIMEYGGGFEDINGRHQSNVYVDHRAHAVVVDSAIRHSARFGLSTERDGRLETSGNTYEGNVTDEVECVGGTNFPSTCAAR